MNNPDVSVVMPVFNAERYVAEAIRSVLDQTYENLELVIIDDKSTDASLSIAKQFETDPRVRIVANDANHGECYSRNRGVLASRGKVIAFADADDICHPDKLKMQMERLRVSGQYVDLVVFTDYYKMDSEGVKIWTGLRSYPYELLQQDAPAALIMDPGVVLCATIVCLKSSALAVGLYDESLRRFGDYDFALRLAKGRKFVGIDVPLYGYRINQTSIVQSTPARTRYALTLKIAERYLKRHPELLNGIHAPEIRRQLARYLIRSRDYRLALYHTIRDPRIVWDLFHCTSRS